jgi:hypothetical protein
MKQRRLILVSLASIAAAFVLLFVLVSPRPGISLTLLEYQRWPHGAMLLLSNGTPATIRCVSAANDTPGGDPLLCTQKTPNGWINSSLAVQAMSVTNSPKIQFLNPQTGKQQQFLNPQTGKQQQLLNSRTGKQPQFLFVVNPGPGPKPGGPVFTLQSREIGPGESVKFFVRMEPGEPPRKVGTFCYLPQNALQTKLQPWLFRLQQWCGMKPRLAGQREIWCPALLSTPPEPDPFGNLAPQH